MIKVSIAASKPLIAAFAQGEIVVVTDDDDRENEGDLFVAASLCTPEKMAFIIRHTSGIVCAPLAARRRKRLHLDPMVAENDAPLGTAFTVSVDVRHGLTTGISAEERTNTVRALANGNSGADDFVRPGHVFPLVAQGRRRADALRPYRGLRRSVPARRACRRSACSSELMNDDGTVMRGPQVAAFAEKHKLSAVSIADLIAYRQARDKLVERVGEFPVDVARSARSRAMPIVTPFDNVQHMAFVYGRIGDGRDVPARLHRADIIGDVFGGAKPIHAALRASRQDGRGVLVYLRDGAAGVPTPRSRRTAMTSSEAARSRQWREIGLGAQILKDLGITLDPAAHLGRLTYVGLAGFGIEIVATEPRARAG